MRRTYQPKERWYPPVEAIALLTGLILGVCAIWWWYWRRFPEKFDMHDFEQAARYRVTTTLLRVECRTRGERTLLARPELFVNLAGSELKVKNVDEEVLSQAREGMPVSVEYRIGKSGLIYVTRVQRARQ